MDKIMKFFAMILSFLLAIFPFINGDTQQQEASTTTTTAIVTTEPTTETTTEPQTETTTQPPVVIDETVNVIYMIGDGMGFNHLESAKAFLGTELFLDTIALKGSVQTRSANSSVTDSAAAGTALACGIKTNNGCVGVYNTDIGATASYPMSLTELAESCGIKTGILTTDSPYGATPAAFSSHTSSRNNSSDIVNQQKTSGIDLLWFATSSSQWSEEDATSNGYSYVTDRAGAFALNAGVTTVGEFTQSTMWKGPRSSVFSTNPSLSELTGKAAELLDNDDTGFFLMIEGAHIDKNAHNNDMEQTAWAVDEFDNAVEAAVNFAQNDGNTVVIVTADHETGGITFADGAYTFTTGSHTGADVPLFVYGDDDLIENGEVLDNTVLSDRIASVFTDAEFPVEVIK